MDFLEIIKQDFVTKWTIILAVVVLAITIYLRWHANRWFFTAGRFLASVAIILIPIIPKLQFSQFWNISIWVVLILLIGILSWFQGRTAYEGDNSKPKTYLIGLAIIITLLFIGLIVLNYWMKLHPYRF